MLIEENMLRAFRGPDGLCRLKPEWRGPLTYADFPKLLAELTEAAKRPNLIRDRALKTVLARDHFPELSGRADQGIVAMVAFTDLVPVLPVTRDWMAFEHQAGGYTCRRILFIGTVLTPKPAIGSAFLEIARANYSACGGWFEGPDVDPEVTEGYLAAVHALGLRCGDQARSELCESIYPIDADPGSLEVCFEDIEDLTCLTVDERAKPLILFLSANSD